MIQFFSYLVILKEIGLYLFKLIIIDKIQFIFKLCKVIYTILIFDNQYIYIKEDAGVSRIVRFSLLIFLKFRRENIVIIQKIRFKNSKGNTILFLLNSKDDTILFFFI